MARSKWLIIATIWLVSLVIVGTYAQQTPANPPNLITGPDLGFSIETHKNGVIHGRLMVRLKGEWVPVGGGPYLLSK
jgi:hypothetical protein